MESDGEAVRFVADGLHQGGGSARSGRAARVPVAIGIDWEGRRYVLGVELANRESESSWKEFLLVDHPQRGEQHAGGEM